MSQVIEVPGMGNVEFPDGMSDDDIRQAIEQQLQQQQQQQQQAMQNSRAGGMGAAMVAPQAMGSAASVAPAMAQGMANAGNNMGQAFQTGQKIVSPAVSGAYNAAKGLVDTYITNPGTAAADVVASHLGLPPPVAAAKAKPLYKGIQQTYQQAKDFVNKTGDFAPVQTNTTANQISAEQMAQAAKEDALNNALTEHLNKVQSGSMNPQVSGPVGGMNYDQKLQWAKANGVKLPDTLATEAGATEAFANPTTQNFMTRISSLAGKYLTPAMIAKELYYTSPEEIATLKAAEAKRRAQGWKPLNEQ